jgi:hypothetical protein
MWMQCYVCEHGLCGHSMQNQRPLECCGFSGTFVHIVFCECVMQNQCTQSKWMLNVNSMFIEAGRCIVEIVNMVSMTLQCRIESHSNNIFAILFLLTWLRWMFIVKSKTTDHVCTWHCLFKHGLDECLVQS